MLRKEMRMKPDKVMAMLSIATKAGKVSSGAFMAEKQIKSNKAYLVIVAKDASENTKKKFHNACLYRDVPYYEYSTSEVMGHSIGKGDRMVLAVLDEALAGSIELRLKEAIEDKTV